MKLKDVLRRYDQYLTYKHNLDGGIDIFRESPFYKRKYNIIELRNQFLGSSNWIRRKLIMMDTRRVDITGNVNRINKRVARSEMEDDSVSRDIARFMYHNQQIIL